MALLAYLAAVLVILFLNAFVVFNFIRYRFKGDQTTLILTLFGIAYLVCIGFTLLLLGSSPTATTGTLN